MPAISGGRGAGEMQGRELHGGQRSHPADEEEAVRETRRPVGLAGSSAGQMAASGVKGGSGVGINWYDSPLTPASISALQDVDHIFQTCPSLMPLQSESEESGLLVKGVGSRCSLRISRNKQQSPGIRKILGIRDQGGFDPAIYFP